MTARDSVDGRSSRPLTAGSAMCADIATRAPAATAARNGTSSRASRLAREEPTVAMPWCGSSAASPAPGKCLIAAATPADWRPRTIARPVPRDQRRIVAERADPERRIGRVRGDVEHRRVDHVDTHRPRLGADRPADALRERHVIDRAERHVAGEWRRPIAQGDELPTFLVGRDEERRGPVGGATAGRQRARPVRCTASVSSRT